MQYQTKVRQKFYFIPGMLAFVNFSMLNGEEQRYVIKKIDHGQSSVVCGLLLQRFPLCQSGIHFFLCEVVIFCEFYHFTRVFGRMRQLFADLA